MSKYKCLLCKEIFDKRNDLFSHYESAHGDQMPEGWNGARYNFDLLYGRTTGRCIMCGKETTWNNGTNRPNKFCSNPKCREAYVKMFKERMKGKYGKEHLLNDPNIQKKMLMNRSISGMYKWSTGEERSYVGSYEHDFLQFLDKFMNFEAKDVFTPAPQVYKYEYEGKEHFYIPDVYIASINTVVEVKDGGSNPNTHHKIMAVDKKKEAIKDKMMESQDVNYIKVVDKTYADFLMFLADLKFEKTNGKNKLNESMTCMTNILNEGVSIGGTRDTLLFLFDSYPGMQYNVCLNFDGFINKLHTVGYDNGSYTSSFPFGEIPDNINCTVFSMKGDYSKYYDDMSNSRYQDDTNASFFNRFLNDIINDEYNSDSIYFKLINNKDKFEQIYSGTYGLFDYSVEDIIRESFEKFNTEENDIDLLLESHVLADEDIECFLFQDTNGGNVDTLASLYDTLFKKASRSGNMEFQEIINMIYNAYSNTQILLVYTKFQNTQNKFNVDIETYRELYKLIKYKMDILSTTRTVVELDCAPTAMVDNTKLVKNNMDAISSNWLPRLCEAVKMGQPFLDLIIESKRYIPLLENEKYNKYTKYNYFGKR